MLKNHVFLLHFGLKYQNLSYSTEINLFKNRKQKMRTKIFSGFKHINFLKKLILPRENKQAEAEVVPSSSLVEVEVEVGVGVEVIRT